jgi:signal transduction histidine kinase
LRFLARPGLHLRRLRRLDDRRPGRSWSELAVDDDGPGIDEGTLARLFEPFYSTRGAGRGIGLATVKAVAERHGGAVDVDSRPGEGACFRVRLERLADA